jgi:hypothetical protein
MTEDLDRIVVAVCSCGRTKSVTFRNVKNKWPQCKRCRRPMRIKKDADANVHAPD